MKKKEIQIFIVLVLLVAYGAARLITIELADTLCAGWGWDYGTADWQLGQYCGYDYSLHPEGGDVERADRLVPVDQARWMMPISPKKGPETNPMPKDQTRWIVGGLS